MPAARTPRCCANVPISSWPADLYVEAVDQHRGWFQVSLITSVATCGTAPYRAVLTHGLILDEAARKMSKSLGNVIAPDEVIKTHGAEILRLLFASVDYTADTCFSKGLINPLLESYRKIRNTCRFLLGNLYDFDPAGHRVAHGELPDLDRWILHRTAELVARARKAYDGFTFHHVVQQLVNFCAVDLSALYLDIVKDRLYCSGAGERGRRAAQTTLWEILGALVRHHGADPVLHRRRDLGAISRAANAPRASCSRDSLRRPHMDDALAATWERLLSARSAVTKALEEARQARSSGIHWMRGCSWRRADGCGRCCSSMPAELPALFIVSQVHLAGELPEQYASPLLPEMRVRVERARGRKCERCWNYSEAVGRAAGHPGLCARCVRVMTAAAA